MIALLNQNWSLSHGSKQTMLETQLVNWLGKRVAR